MTVFISTPSSVTEQRYHKLRRVDSPSERHVFMKASCRKDVGTKQVHSEQHIQCTSDMKGTLPFPLIALDVCRVFSRNILQESPVLCQLLYEMTFWVGAVFQTNICHSVQCPPPDSDSVSSLS